MLNGTKSQHASLVIRDSSPGQTGTITGGFTQTGGDAGGIHIYYGDVTLQSGSITGNACYWSGGGAVRIAGGTFTMTGGSITGNVANTSLRNDSECGGAIFFYGDGEVHISGGSITGNYSHNTLKGCGGISGNDGLNSTHKEEIYLSGNYILKDNYKGTNNAGTWIETTASDYIHGQRDYIYLEGAITPTGVTAVEVKSDDKPDLIQDWSTYMGTADPENYFTIASSGSGLGIVDGKARIGTLHNITLATGLSASVTSAAQGKPVTLSGANASGTIAGITYTTDYIVIYNDGNDDNADRYRADANGNATFLMPDSDATVSSETLSEIAYVDADGSTKYCTSFTVIQSSNSQVILGSAQNNEKWYVVSGEVIISKGLLIRDQSAHLILCDGATLTVNNDDSEAVFCGNSLTIYGQSGGTGTLCASTTGASYEGINTYGNLTINGGNVNAASAYYYGLYTNVGNITINGGTLTATSINNSGIFVKQANVIINGGALTATSSVEGNIGCGIYFVQGNIIINGGIVNVTGDLGIYHVGSVTLGWTSPDDRITVSRYNTDTGGTVTIKDGQSLWNGSEALSGTISDKSKINGKMLQPYMNSQNHTAHAAKVMGEAKYVTSFYNGTRNYQLPDGAVAYTAGLVDGEVVFYRIGENSNIIPHNTAVIIVADASALSEGDKISLTSWPSSDITPHAGNILQGSDGAISKPAGTVYVLGVDGGGNMAFVTFTGETIPAGKAYYVLNQQ